MGRMEENEVKKMGIIANPQSLIGNFKIQEAMKTKAFCVEFLNLNSCGAKTQLTWGYSRFSYPIDAEYSSPRLQK